MSQNWGRLILIGAFLFAGSATSVILVSRAYSQSHLASEGSPQVARPRSRNLSLQPEASRVNRRLGNRLKLSEGRESILAGNLTLSGNQQSITIIRRLTESDEIVELLLAGRRITWSDSEGIRATSVPASEPERLLIERLIFDSPDQFVLAQLRGASYSTITRSLRPSDAGENYTGPLWTLVRISEPQRVNDPTQKRPWRLYYINEVTDLIDRVEYEFAGQTIETTIKWTERDGGPVPLLIKWTTGAQTVMEFEVASFSTNK